MFCPGCGFQVNDDLRFCRQCGAKLQDVRNAMSSHSASAKFDWSKTWWADMIYSPEELERRRGVTPQEKRLMEEKKRLNEIKGGVITGMVGVGVMIAFYFFFSAVAKQAGDGAEIVRNLWLLGIIPTLIGAGLLINGFFISKRLVELSEELTRAASPASSAQSETDAKTTDQLTLDSAPAERYSVKENSTAHLIEPVPSRLRGEKD